MCCYCVVLFSTLFTADHNYEKLGEIKTLFHHEPDTKTMGGAFDLDVHCSVGKCLSILLLSPLKFL